MDRHTFILNRLLIFFLLILPHSAMAKQEAGDRIIHFSGLLKPDIAARQTIKTIEQNFELTAARLYNPWEKREEVYSGLFLDELVAKYALPETRKIRFIAIDGYSIVIEWFEWQKYRTLLATRINERHLSVRQKGPMRIVFPDYVADNEEYKANLHQWMWMINRIEFK